MKYIFTLLTIFILGCSSQFDISQTEQEVHSWSNYHWPDTDLTVQNKIKDSAWQSHFDATLSAWDNLSTPLSISEGSPGMIVTETRRSRQWLGLASIYVDGDGHITSGKVTMNPILLSDSRYSPEAAQHVFCQELGHVLGLGHIEDDTCMDDCAGAESTEAWLDCLNDPLTVDPNQHDEDQLNLIYGHTDVVPDTPDAGSTDGCGNSRRPGCRQEGWTTIHSFPMFD
jgi:hypothetical protein